VTDQRDDDIIGLLRSVDVSSDEVDAAAKDGRGALIALYADRAFVPGKERITRIEVARRAGIDLEQAAALWRALGFPDVSDNEPIFTEVDVEVLERAAQLMALGVIDSDLALQMARVIGRATAQIAAAQVDTATRAVGDDAPELPPLLAQVPVLMDDIEKWIVHIWRRHFAAEIKRAALQIAAGDSGTAVVGFADLVGFTGISQQMDEEALAHAVSAFESAAVEIVGRHYGRVVKMIGDEAMFEAPDAGAGARIALDLVDAISADDGLPDVRVGLAAGPALRNEGDLFGVAPNLASRLTDEAYPGAVLVSESVHEALEEEPGFAFKAARPRSFKGFGRTRFWVLRREGEEEKRPAWRRPIERLPIELPEIPFLDRDRD
jgi:adenylate cyclase